MEFPIQQVQRNTFNQLGVIRDRLSFFIGIVLGYEGLSSLGFDCFYFLEEGLFGGELIGFDLFLFLMLK